MGKLEVDFVHDEADAILQLPLSINLMCDSILWHYDKRGNFSVKSAYKLAFQLQFGDIPSCSNGPSFVWKFIWNLQIPAKIKIFCWRACRDILPTKDLIFRRKISVSPCCELCGLIPETVDHALLAFVCFVVDKKLASQFIVSAWFCWNKRNQLVHGSKRLAEECFWSKAGFYLNEFMQNDFVQNEGISSSHIPANMCWKPPDGHCLKLNVDASVNKAAGKIGIGVVVRDSVGQLVLAAGLSCSFVVDVAVA
ncbi:hypothetical protein ACOSQ3_009503 [Xanthoceras sorbifolium]